MTTKTATIVGNTYPVKDQIKALSPKVRWNAAAKGWDVPVEFADAARALVGAAPVKQATNPRARDGSTAYGPRKGYSSNRGAPRWDGVSGSSSYYSSGAYDDE